MVEKSELWVEKKAISEKGEGKKEKKGKEKKEVIIHYEIIVLLLLPKLLDMIY